MHAVKCIFQQTIIGRKKRCNRPDDRTGNIVLVGKMLGHHSVTTTLRYLHPEMKGIAELVNACNATRVAEQKD